MNGAEHSQTMPAILPILLGGGISLLLPSFAVRRRLTLSRHRAYPSGMMLLESAFQQEG